MGCACSVAPNPLKVDQTHFVTLRTIGKGGFGTVTAVQKTTEPFKGQLFAMKKLAKCQLIDSSSGLKVAWRERNILQMVNTPFIPKLHYAFQDNASLFLVLDFLSGGDIAYLIKQHKRVEEAHAQIYAAEIALGLCELHHMNVVFRDLKPANVLLDKHGHARIIDFGIASILEEKHEYRTRGDAGTPGYQSPEMIGGRSYHFEPDFFAYGVTIYQMLTGKRPFNDNEHMAQCHAVPQSWHHVSDTARALITSLLHVDPRERLTDWTAIKAHKFFDGIDWVRLAKCTGDGPFVPDPDIANFPVECNAEALLMPEDDKPVQDQTLFNGFTFNGHLDLERGLAGAPQHLPTKLTELKLPGEPESQKASRFGSIDQGVAGQPGGGGGGGGTSGPGRRPSQGQYVAAPVRVVQKIDEGPAALANDDRAAS